MRLKDVLARMNRMLPYFALLLSTQNFVLASEARAARIESAELLRSLELEKRQHLIINNEIVKNKVINWLTELRIYHNTGETQTNIISELAKRLLDPAEREFIDLNCQVYLNSVGQKGGNNIMQQILQEYISNGVNETVINQSSSFLHDIFMTLNNFMSSLNVEQLVAVTNIIGLFVIIYCCYILWWFIN